MPPPAQLFPGPREVVLVLAPLDVPEQRLAALRATFSGRDAARYTSFAHEEHRVRWGAARGTLREVLGSALGVLPAQVSFRYGGHGKPEVPGSALRFNISHSGGLALIALAQVEVGVDVELPRPRRTDGIARRFYAPAEVERLFAVEDEAARRELFFRLWTCKEAFLKATGEGLSRSTRSYQIDLDEAGARLAWATGIPDAAQRYSVHPLEPGDPYRAALVAEGQGLGLRRYRWP
jgi:4'-phosphopantetheinyl transferase